ncbi:MAG TPA: FAD-dependent oxidoreductase [Dehalococcoidia bacterium]|nr:FAD-dependent oxidoreductase [Dehalococcoidia bacterium]
MTLTELFKPFRLGSLELKNRIVMPPIGTRLANEQGAVTQRLIDFLEERAKGGVGLIIIEAAAVDGLLGRTAPTGLCLDHDKYIAELNELVEAIHAWGARVAIQLFHAGRETRLPSLEGRQPVAPSPIACASLGIAPRQLSIPEIETLAQKFAEAARRARDAGCDAVEMHGAHGYLIGQFLSPYSNRRTDRYGGDLEGRMRFATEILVQTRSKVGAKFPVLLRITAQEYIEGGLGLEDSQAIAQRAEAAGYDAIHVSAGIYESMARIFPPQALPPGCHVENAAAIKKAVRLPVIAVGRINDPLTAEDILKEGKADLVAMGRALIADPELPRKAAQGRFDEIRRCIACNYCVERIFSFKHIRCAVNPAAGRERGFCPTPAAQKKRVLIVGGGPAGMEAARVARLRGHEVSLVEKTHQLGGQLHLAANAPHKGEMRSLIHYLSGQIQSLGVDIRLGQEATAESIARFKPDAVVVATGASPLLPPIPGIEKGHPITAWEVRAGKAVTGTEVVILGGGMVGCETAELLAEQGKKVRIIEMLPAIASDIEPISRGLLLERMARLGIEALTNVKVEEIAEDGVWVAGPDRRRHFLPAQAIVLALGSTANDGLRKSLPGPEVYAIGDCVEPRKLPQAMEEGWSIALRL